MNRAKPGFSGFGPEAFTFLRELRENNNAAWFKPRKTLYETAVRAPMGQLVLDLSEGMKTKRLPLHGDPARSVFRIYRDVRFSRDKRPYNVAASFALTRNGDRRSPGILYVHFEPGAKSFLAAGFWQPSSGLLTAWRRDMVRAPRAFLTMHARLERAGLALQSGDEVLKRLPRGFEDQDNKNISAFLRWKSFVVRRELSDRELAGPKLVALGISFATTARPLLDYGWSLVDHLAEG
jgi:uncharacterized protein (TIGR02453 family)